MFATLSEPVLLVLAAFIGILVGLLLALIFRNDAKTNPGENPLPKKYIDQGYTEATRLYYSPASKKSITQLDGDFYFDFDALTPEQKKRILRFLQAWKEWCGQGEQVQAIEHKEVAPVVEETPIPGSLEKPAPIQPAEKVLAAAPVLATPVPASQRPGKPQTIVEQINDILEEIAANSPEKKRGIRLVDNGHEGVLVWVGIEKFNGVDAVPYPEVQALIKAAVTRWEEEAGARNRATAPAAK